MLYRNRNNTEQMWSEKQGHTYRNKVRKVRELEQSRKQSRQEREKVGTERGSGTRPDKKYKESRNRNRKEQRAFKE